MSFILKGVRVTSMCLSSWVNSKSLFSVCVFVRVCASAPAVEFLVKIFSSE